MDLRTQFLQEELFRFLEGFSRPLLLVKGDDMRASSGLHAFLQGVACVSAVLL